MEGVILNRLAKAIHDVQFDWLSPERRDGRWLLIKNSPEARTYRRMALAVVQELCRLPNVLESIEKIRRMELKDSA